MTFEMKNRISNICTYAALPATLNGVIYGLMALLHVPVSIMDSVMITFYVVGFLAIIVSSFTCGTLRRLGGVALRASAAVRSIIPTGKVLVLFLILVYYVSYIVLVVTFSLGVFFPAVTIALSARNKRREMMEGAC